MSEMDCITLTFRVLQGDAQVMRNIPILASSHTCITLPFYWVQGCGDARMLGFSPGGFLKDKATRQVLQTCRAVPTNQSVSKGTENGAKVWIRSRI